jgi:zinc transporter ZupT
MEENLLLAFALTTFAGLSTGFGSFLAFFVQAGEQAVPGHGPGLFRRRDDLRLLSWKCCRKRWKLLDPVHGEHDRRLDHGRGLFRRDILHRHYRPTGPGIRKPAPCPLRG